MTCLDDSNDEMGVTTAIDGVVILDFAKAFDTVSPSASVET